MTTELHFAYERVRARDVRPGDAIGRRWTSKFYDVARVELRGPNVEIFYVAGGASLQTGMSWWYRITEHEGELTGDCQKFV